MWPRVYVIAQEKKMQIKKAHSKDLTAWCYAVK